MLLVLIALFFPVVAIAGPETGSKKPAGLPTEETFSDSLRAILLRFLPDPLYEAAPGWGKTRRVANGITWTGKRINIKPEIQYKDKNDGAWRKVRVVGDNVPQNLVVSAYDFKPVDKERFRFELFLALPVKVHVHQQRWESGVRLYDGTARARLRLNFWLTCEAGMRLDGKDKLLPDLVVHLKVVKATFRWSEFHLEHAAGLGGEAAEFVGDVLEKYITDWKPSLEKEFIAKAEAAVLKAGKSRELRLGAGKLLETKK